MKYKLSLPKNLIISKDRLPWRLLYPRISEPPQRTSEEWQKYHDEISRTLVRTMYAIIVYCVFCFLTLSSSDLDLVSNRTTLPLVNVTIGYKSFLIAGPLILIGITLFLHIYINLLVSIPVNLVKNPLPFLFNIQGSLPKFFSMFFFYWLPPITLSYFVYNAGPSRYVYPLLLLTIYVTILLLALQIRRWNQSQNGHSVSLHITNWIALIFMVVLSFFVVFDYHYQVITPKLRRSLSLVGADLTKIDLKDINLTRADMRCANLRGANLNSLSLVYANLSESDLTEAKLLRADLRSANLSGSILIRADLRHSNLEEANLSNTILEKADLRGAKFGRTTLFQNESVRSVLNRAVLDPEDIQKFGVEIANLTEANLSNTKLDGMELIGTILIRANLANTSLCKADLRCSQLNRAILKYADLKESDLSGADLSEADLSGARLDNANLHLVKLKNAILQNAQLIGSDMYLADLQGANLSDATLFGANLLGTKLKDADLRNVNLWNVENLELDQLIETKTLWNAKLENELLEQVQANYPNILKKPIH